MKEDSLDRGWQRASGEWDEGLKRQTEGGIKHSSDSHAQEKETSRIRRREEEVRGIKKEIGGEGWGWRERRGRAEGWRKAAEKGKQEGHTGNHARVRKNRKRERKTEKRERERMCICVSVKCEHICPYTKMNKVWKTAQWNIVRLLQLWSNTSSTKITQ